MAAVQLVHEAIDAAALLTTVGSPDAGANVLFTGTTRRWTGVVTTDWLDYEAYELLARTELERLRDEAISRFGLADCGIIHRLGRVAVGETSVAVAVSAAHRREAFAAAEWLLEQLKRQVPIWKREAGPAGMVWVHPKSVGPPGTDAS
ncbi:MAG: Cyclic pyranopterin monophosphate synthase [Planctomycetota bacterium]